MSFSPTEHLFADFLIAHSLVSADLLQQAKEIGDSARLPLTRTLVKLGFIPERVLADSLATFSEMPRFTGEIEMPVNLGALSPKFLREHCLAPLSVDGSEIRVAMADPLDEFALRGVEFAIDQRVSACVSTFGAISSAWTRRAPDNIDAVEDSGLSDGALDALRDIASDAPAIRLVQRLLTLAVDRQASDIHLEPIDSCLKVRFRIDGVLQDMESLPLSHASSVTSRIKVMATLNIAERRLPQDGRLRITVNGKGVDFRVATAPTMHGEAVVLRILDRQQVELDFERLGFDSGLQAILRRALQRPYGIILATGPTGSGKTTTLYTALKEINEPSRKIITVEDPIEYTLPGVNQTQVKPQIGYTFATALRSFLRQDPDVLMVGEIRDRETAEVAIQAALTGHLLLSTLHTNTASAAVTRLLDMGIDDYLLTSTLNLIIGQRLVRRLCKHCRIPYRPSQQVVERFGLTGWNTAEEDSLYRAQGCEQCAHVGYQGRTGLLELLDPTEAIQQLILSRADAGAIEREAVRLGMRTLFQHGLALARTGQTTLEEVLRVTRVGS